MRRVLCLLYVTILSISIQAQDFVSRYRQMCVGDTTLTYVSVSPKMMEKALESESEESNADVQDIIAHLKSMQVISGNHKAAHHFTKAEEILKRNTNRYQPYSSYNGEDEHCNISVRKRNGNIVELVMLKKQSNQFVAVSFTGILDDRLIHKMTKVMKMSK